MGGGVSGVGGAGGAGGGAVTSDGGVGGGSAMVPPCRLAHTGSLVGAVFEPSGQLALANVLVYVPSSPLDDFPRGPSGRCLGCEADVSGNPLVSTLTTADGTFRLDDVPVGQVSLVFQTGRWRRQVDVTVLECATQPVLPDSSRLPRSKAEGHLPKMALVTGAADPLECLLLKLGIDRAEFTRPDAGGAIHLYQDNGQLLLGGQPSGYELFGAGDFGAYDALLVPCRGNEYVMGQATRQKMADYLDVGGRLFITHYGYTWMRGAPFSVTANWEPTNAGNGFDSASVVSNFPRGAIYRQWLTNVAHLGPAIAIVDARYNVGAVQGRTAEYLGADGRRMSTDPHWTAQLSFTTPVGADAGCGRVAFSDFHVSTNATQVPLICQAPPCPPPPPFPDNCLAGAFTDQEKVLVYILFDLGTCPRDDRAEVSVCASLDAGCGLRQPCCGDLRCLNVAGTFCDGGRCACSP